MCLLFTEENIINSQMFVGLWVNSVFKNGDNLHNYVIEPNFIIEFIAYLIEA